jgi:adenine-specific DNA-methyltransferase
MTEVPGPSSTETTSPSVRNLEEFKRLFPGVIQDGVLDAARLGELLDTDVAGLKQGKERFGLMWAGKKLAVEALQTSSMAALSPDLENSINWDTAENVFIEGDNLEVLKLLQNAYNDQVKLIYIDPPYNTGNDFVYNDDFSDPIKHYLEITGQVDAQGNRLVANTETSGRKHSNWLSMMFPRLVLARNLLTQDGVICISIDDNEVHNLRALLDEVFGQENFLTQFVWKSKSGGANDTKNVATDHEYVLAYARNLSLIQVNLDTEAEATTSYSKEDDKGFYSLERLDKQNLGYQKTLDFPIVGPDGAVYKVQQKDPNNPQARWRWSETSVKERYEELVFEKGQVYTKNYKKDGVIPRSLLVDERFGRTRTGSTEVSGLMGGPYFDNPKSTRLIGHLVRIFTGPSDLVIDFFAGSGTTGHAVSLQNAKDGGKRRYLLVTLDESTPEASYARAQGLNVVSEITLLRLKRVAETVEGAAKQGLRMLRLAQSSFERSLRVSDDGQILLNAQSLLPGADAKAVVAEMLLHVGARLDAAWANEVIGGMEFVKTGTTLCQFGETLTEEIIPIIQSGDFSQLLLREDSFAGRDAMRANAFYEAKKFNVQLKTF